MKTMEDLPTMNHKEVLRLLIKLEDVTDLFEHVKTVDENDCELDVPADMIADHAAIKARIIDFYVNEPRGAAFKIQQENVRFLSWLARSIPVIELVQMMLSADKSVKKKG